MCDPPASPSQVLKWQAFITKLGSCCAWNQTQGLLQTTCVLNQQSSSPALWIQVCTQFQAFKLKTGDVAYHLGFEHLIPIWRVLSEVQACWKLSPARQWLWVYSLVPIPVHSLCFVFIVEAATSQLCAPTTVSFHSYGLSL